jgi:hypothetical protein
MANNRQPRLRTAKECGLGGPGALSWRLKVRPRCALPSRPILRHQRTRPFVGTTDPMCHSSVIFVAPGAGFLCGGRACALGRMPVLGKVGGNIL